MLATTIARGLELARTCRCTVQRAVQRYQVGLGDPGGPDRVWETETSALILDAAAYGQLRPISKARFSGCGKLARMTVPNPFS